MFKNIRIETFNKLILQVSDPLCIRNILFNSFKKKLIFNFSFHIQRNDFKYIFRKIMSLKKINQKFPKKKNFQLILMSQFKVHQFFDEWSPQSHWGWKVTINLMIFYYLLNIKFNFFCLCNINDNSISFSWIFIIIII